MATSTDIQINQLHERDPRWFAVYTRYKSEKSVRDQLLRQDIHAWVPCRTITRQYTRKIKRHELPLISCYTFVYISREEYLSVLRTEGVHDFVRLGKDLLAIPEEEIELMQRVIGEKMVVDIERTELVEGDRIEIIGGQLTGKKGKVIKWKNKDQVAISLDTLGFSLILDVDIHMLRKVSLIT